MTLKSRGPIPLYFELLYAISGGEFRVYRASKRLL